MMQTEITPCNWMDSKHNCWSPPTPLSGSLQAGRRKTACSKKSVIFFWTDTN